MPDAQAEAITRLQQQAVAATLEQAKHDYQRDELATRRDLGVLRSDMEALRAELKKDIEASRHELKKDIEVLRAETRQNIAETKAELIRWVVGAGLLQTALITGVLLKVARLI
ncbi:MAG: DUF1640 domain-containing protein [Methylococcaceae bacterium]|nr:MAG: DUF1640 domain-containing protein [Methylococcaceae bacterium]